VRSEFARIAKDDPSLDRKLASFLAQAYNLKVVADYGVGPDVGVTVSEAAEAIDGAAFFVDSVKRALSLKR
jgi:uncharacterized protein (UPF0332 family)